MSLYSQAGIKCRKGMSVVYTIPHVPWVPTRDDIINTLLKMLKPNANDVFMDLGCGDGRVVIAVAKKFKIRTVCIELRKELVEKAKEAAAKEGVIDLITFIEDDFFKVRLPKATIVYMYLLTSVNQKLRPKLESELANGTIIITLDFPIPEWQPIHVIELPRAWQRTLYIYVKGYSDVGHAPQKEYEKLIRAKLSI